MQPITVRLDLREDWRDWTDLLGRHTLTIPVLDAYSYSVPEVVADPQRAMAARCTAALEGRFAPSSVPPRYANQLDEELGVIEASGMAGYMMLVAQVTDWLRDART